MNRTPQPPLTVAVIGGGQNCEHAVSLATAAAVAHGLEQRNHQVLRFTIDSGGSWALDGTPLGLPAAVARIQECSAIFPALHGPRGEDGTLRAFADVLGVPCVGSSVAAGAIAMDKAMTKLVAASVGVATASGTVVSRGDSVAWSGPVVVKPLNAGSSQGVSLVSRPDALPAALDGAWAFSERAVVEEYVVGREIDVAVMIRSDGEAEVSPALEIVHEGIFDFTTKYGGVAEFHVPAALDARLVESLNRAALRVFDALGCAGVARFDFFLRDGTWLLNEVNTMPGLTPHSQVPRMFEAAGIDYADVLDDLVRSAAAPGGCGADG